LGFFRIDYVGLKIPPVYAATQIVGDLPDGAVQFVPFLFSCHALLLDFIGLVA